MKKILDEINLPYAYNHFSEGESPNPPFICYLFPKSDNFSADGSVYLSKSEVVLELYTDSKDLKLENKIEKVLIKNNIFFEKSEVYIAVEKLYEVIYYFTINMEEYYG